MTDYKKKYYEALEKAEEFYNDKNNIQYANVEGMLEEIFPELKESEDERIRKEIIYHIKNCDDTIDEETEKRMLAWLEKQVTPQMVEDAFLKGCNDTKKSLLKKQGEQKPADKIEPKFKVGDWVVSPNGVYWHIDAIQNGRYEVTADTGQCGNWPLDTNIYRLWTIQDAKDGDVLYHKAENGIEYIVMNKGLNENNNIDSYFRYNSIDGFGIDIPSVLSAKRDSINPATKEQCDLLFQKMKEAGYEWDAKKKELKLLITNGCDFFELENCEQKSNWSEDDNIKIQNLIILVKYGGSIETDLRDEYEDWLKSLKDRVLSQNTWKPSDEQMDALYTYIYNPQYFNTPDPRMKLVVSTYEDLKKLKGE